MGKKQGSKVSTLYFLFYMVHIVCRQALIDENIRCMPEMVADYRKKMLELRQKTRKSRSEEEYYLAIGKSHKEVPDWQVFKDSKAIKQKKK